MVLSDCDHLIKFSKDGVDIEDSDGGVVVNKKFRGQYHDVFIIPFTLVVYKGSGKEVGGGVGFARDVFNFEPVIL